MWDTISISSERELSHTDESIMNYHTLVSLTLTYKLELESAPPLNPDGCSLLLHLKIEIGHKMDPSFGNETSFNGFQ